MEDGGFLYFAGLIPTVCPIGSGRAARTATDHALHARHERHAIYFHAAGLQLRRSVLPPISRIRSTRSYAKGRRRFRNLLSVSLHYRLVRRPTRAASLAQVIDYVPEPRSGLDAMAASTSRATGLASIRRPADGSLRASRGRCSSSASARRLRTLAMDPPWSPTTRGSRRKRDYRRRPREGIRWRRRPTRDPRMETRANPRPPRPRRQAPRACQVAERVDRRKNRRARGSTRLSFGRTRQVLPRSTTPIGPRFGFPFIMAVKGKSQGRHSGGLRAPPRQRRGRRDQDPRLPRSAALRRCGSEDILS